MSGVQMPAITMTNGQSWTAILSICWLPEYRSCLVAGSYDAFLNVQIAIVIMFQILLCIGLACGSLGWRNYSGYERTHLVFTAYNQGNYKNNFLYAIVLWITYWILLSYLVPISLFVTMEIVKFLMVSSRSKRPPLHA